MNAPTPGPWHFKMVSEKSWHVGVYDQSGNEVALVKVKSALHSARRDADARLIAASPKMYSYIEGRAQGGDLDAAAILESINAAR